MEDITNICTCICNANTDTTIYPYFQKRAFEDLEKLLTKIQLQMKYYRL